MVGVVALGESAPHWALLCLSICVQKGENNFLRQKKSRLKEEMFRRNILSAAQPHHTEKTGAVSKFFFCPEAHMTSSCMTGAAIGGDLEGGFGMKPVHLGVTARA